MYINILYDKLEPQTTTKSHKKLQELSKVLKKY